jgi:hypothetical protein
MRVTRILAAATTAALLALVTATPAFASGFAATSTGDTGRIGEVAEEDVLHDIRPAILGVHQGIASSFVEVPVPDVATPNVAMPNVAMPRMPAR